VKKNVNKGRRLLRRACTKLDSKFACRRLEKLGD